MSLEKYIARINYTGKLSTNYTCLRDLHRCHVMSVPFENLDVQFHRKIKLDLTNLYDKVVLNSRGGFCYELNYLFYSLLSEIGFDATMISSRIFNEGSYGPAFDHMSIVVKLDEYWLVDVGYGDLFIEPLKLYATNVQEDYFKKYRLEPLNDREFLLLESLKNRQDFTKRYILDLEPRTIDAFFDQCEYKQSSPDSYFVKNTVCTMPTKYGRKTILNDTFKIRNKDEVRETKISGNTNLLKILKDEFNISMRNEGYKDVYDVHSC